MGLVREQGSTYIGGDSSQGRTEAGTKLVMGVRMGIDSKEPNRVLVGRKLT
jgi:hypothetical protein